jgi:DNA-binding transcriptional ArsR family regulator
MYFFYKSVDLPQRFCYNEGNAGKEAPRVTDRQIRCFLALYETLNFSAAARQLFLTQPTLSYQIRTLEEELGTPLFTRTTCRVEPTEAGQLFAAFEEDKFRPQPDAARTEDVFACDLLIIDDLGTEMTTQFTVSVLYQLLNTRLMEKKPVILSTNLTPGELASRYSPQIASRILGTYRLCQFCGDDIRFKIK